MVKRVYKKIDGSSVINTDTTNVQFLSGSVSVNLLVLQQ